MGDIRKMGGVVREGWRRKDSQGKWNENPAHISAVPRTLPGTRSLVYRFTKPCRFCPSTEAFHGAREILDHSPVAKGACRRLLPNLPSYGPPYKERSFSMLPLNIARA